MQWYQFFDKATLAYVALVGVLMLLGDGLRVAHGPWILLSHAMVLLFLPLLIRQGSKPDAARWLVGARHFYPALMFPLCYRESEHLNQMFVRGYLDPGVIRLEEAVFGCQPSLVLMEAMPWLGVSELFYAAYFSFYVMVLGMGVYLYRSDRVRLAHYVSVTVTVFYGCYLCFIFLPIIGPRLFMGPVAGYALPAGVMPLGAVDYPEGVTGGPMFLLMGFIYEHAEGAGGSVPSSHVAVAVCTVWFSFLYARRIWCAHLMLVMLLCLSTVYCRYHYAVDVVAGLVAAAFLIPLGHWGHMRDVRGRSG